MSTQKFIRNTLTSIILSFSTLASASFIQSCTFYPKRDIVSEVSHLDLYDGLETRICYLTREEGEQDLAHLARTKLKEEAFLFVDEDNLWIDIGEKHISDKEILKYYPRSEKYETTGRAMGIEVDLRYLKQIINMFNLKGKSITFYHFHPDPDFLTKLSSNAINTMSIYGNFPSAVDFSTSFFLQKLVTKLGSHPTLPRVVGSMYSIEFDPKDNNNVQKTQDIFDQARSVFFEQYEGKEFIDIVLDYEARLNDAGLYVRILNGIGLTSEEDLQITSISKKENE